MDIKEISDNLQKIYADMSQTFMNYQKSTGLHCPSGCGACCMNPEVETTIIEMLPFAFKALEDNKIEQWIEQIESAPHDQCPLLEKTVGSKNGKCLSYAERPAICRMFGVSGLLDKHQEKTLTICKILKETFPDRTNEIKKLPVDAPLIPEWMFHINNLAPFAPKYSIKNAALSALKKVALFAQYH